MESRQPIVSTRRGPNRSLMNPASGVVNTMAIGVMPTASPALLLENPRTSSRYMNTNANNMEDPIMLTTVAIKNRCNAGLNERNPVCDIRQQQYDAQPLCPCEFVTTRLPRLVDFR
jgi:hypothetical protein